MKKTIKITTKNIPQDGGKWFVNLEVVNTYIENIFVSSQETGREIDYISDEVIISEEEINEDNIPQDILIRIRKNNEMKKIREENEKKEAEKKEKIKAEFLKKEITGKKISHVRFGAGEIIEEDNNMKTILFQDGKVRKMNFKFVSKFITYL